MTDLSRRSFLTLAAAIAAVSTLPPILAAEAEVPATVFEDPTSLYARLNIALERALVPFRGAENNFENRLLVIRTAQAVMDQFTMYTREVYDYSIVCDERNNPPDVIETCLPQVDIVYQPDRTIQYFWLHPKLGVTNLA